ncbi:hypothetical protein LTR37_016277 [Vermiconidia calcicola]|uniref:Uncharacterized protein n=1 Tax=Vermiconidia calcicola TaxID=1690605 RepID=A0ACC3MNA5_9PEZI|nr:hypothetical protein LTR37_016277 [Vermiconidia calcicola]
MRGLEFFHRKVASSLSAYFDEEFWTRIVAQMSYSEPAIRHAMAAIGTHQSGNLVAQSSKQALLQYNKAIKVVSERTSSANSTDMTLVVCLLFVCLEFLRGDATRALRHSNAGVRIAMSCRSLDNTAGHEQPAPQIRRHVLPIYSRLALHCTQFSSEVAFDYPLYLADTIADVFLNVQHAGESIVHLMNLSNRFMRNIRTRSARQSLTPDDYEAQSALLGRLSDWSKSADRMLLSVPLREDELCAARILRLHHTMTTIWLAKSMVPNECAYDDSMDDFEMAVTLAEAVCSSVSYRVNGGGFSFHPDISHPLYHIATKCRAPAIRRRAVQLLRTLNRREAFWDSNVAAAIAERVVEIEERMLLTAGALPAEEHRIHSVTLDSEISKAPGKHKATFYMKTKGLGGPWRVWLEAIKV